MWQKKWNTILDVISTEKSLYDYLKKLNHNLTEKFEVLFILSPLGFQQIKVPGFYVHYHKYLDISMRKS